MNRSTLRGIPVLCLALMAAPAMAQQTTAPQDIATLDTVVVSVQKREELASDVPRAMTVVDAQTLARSGIDRVDGLAHAGPNMSSSQAGGVSLFTLRGIGGGGRNIGFDPRVGVYLDGVYIGQSAALIMPLFGIDQAVLLRGPQGSLFGRNSVAGAIVLTSQPPPDTFARQATVGVGTHERQQIQATIGGPIGDRVRVSAGVSRDKREGVATNLFDGQDLDNQDRWSARAQMVIDASDRDTVRVSVDKARVNERNIMGVASTGFFGTPIDALPDRTVDLNTTPSNRATIQGGSAQWDHHDASDRTWTVIAGSRDTTQARVNDTDYSAADLVRVDYEDRFEIHSLEARVANDSVARSRFVAGVYLADEKARTQRTVTIGRDTNTLVPVPGMPMRLPFGMAFGLVPGLGAQADGRVETQQAALFGSWDYDLTERWTTHVGGRLSRERKQVAYTLDGRGSGRLLIASINDFRDERTVDHFSPSAGLTYRFSDDLRAYATYSSGYKSGGWNLDFLNRGQAAGDFSFDDEQVRSMELGLKGQRGNLAFDVAVFQARIEDYQVFQLVPLGNGGSVLQLRNAAQARSRGIEAQGAWQANRHLKLHSSLGLLDAQFTDFPDGDATGANLRGNRLNEAPRTTALLGAQLTWAGLGGQWALDAQARYRSENFTGPSNTDNERLAAQTISDLRLGYAANTGRWEASAWVRNLTDERGDVFRTRDFFGHEVGKQHDPRMAGVDFTVHF